MQPAGAPQAPTAPAMSGAHGPPPLPMDLPAPPAHRQLAPLHGTVAWHTAAVGVLAAGAGGLGVWTLRGEPALLFAGAVVTVPLLGFGAFLLGLAAWLRFGQATWQLDADADRVALAIRTARGRVLRRETVPVAALERIAWIAGDADIAAGLRFHARTGRSLFVPADAFDCAALAAFAAAAYPGVAAAGLAEQMAAPR